MPSAPLRYCAAPQCSARVPRGYCEAHARQQRRQVNQDGHGVYRTARWRRLRLQVLEEQPFCGDGCGRLGIEVHHRIHRDVRPDLFWERSNLVGLCHACHSARTRRGE